MSQPLLVLHNYYFIYLVFGVLGHSVLCSGTAPTALCSKVDPGSSLGTMNPGSHT